MLERFSFRNDKDIWWYTFDVDLGHGKRDTLMRLRVYRSRLRRGGA
jgi:hypothetical protein